mgnify:CR=1 FL=1
MYSAIILLLAPIIAAVRLIQIVVEDQARIKKLQLRTKPVKYPMNRLFFCLYIPIIGSQSAVLRIQGMLMNCGKYRRRRMDPIAK